MGINTFKKSALIASAIATPTLLLGSSFAFGALEEIIVTANKRSESANEIGLSIAAISGDKLAEQKLTSLEEITSGVPGLSFATSQQGTPILTLRGVGFNESSMGVYPATSLYVDEIPLPFPVMATHSAYDLERVEVLKGPQGVLFGQNSTGGAINFIAAKPTEDLSYGVDVSYGRFNKIETNTFVSSPLSDSIGARLAIQNVSADHWQKSVTRDDENGEEDYTAARLSLIFDLSDAATIGVNINGWKDKSDPQAFQFVAATPKSFDAAPSQAALQFPVPFTNKDARSADWSPNAVPEADKEFIQTSIRGDFDLSDDITLTTLFAYGDYEQDMVKDGDGYHLNTADFLETSGSAESLFAEVRLAGEGDSANWVVGINYEDSTTEEDQYLDYSDGTSSRPTTVYINTTGANLQQDIETYAVFGNVNYDLTEELTLKVGARYTDTTIDAESCGYASANVPGVPDTSNGTGSNITRLFGEILGPLSGRPFDPLQLGDCFSLDGPAGVGIPGVFIDTLAEDNVSWRIGLDYQVNDDTLVYANLSQGYKTGSYPTLTASTWAELEPVTQESVLAYELGIKASLADNTVQLNSAIFLYDYEDKQVRGKVFDPLFGPLDTLVNVPKSTIQGIEADIVAQLTDALTLTAAVTYIDSEVDKYTGFNVYGDELDLSGNDVPLTPELSYSLDLDYRITLDNGGILFMGANVTGQSDSDAVFGASDLSIQDTVPRGGITGVDAGVHKSITENYFVVEEYFTVGARLGYESEDGHWKLMLWGKNITDEYYWNSVIASSEAGVRAAGRPRTYGLTLGYTY